MVRTHYSPVATTPLSCRPKPLALAIRCLITGGLLLGRSVTPASAASHPGLPISVTQALEKQLHIGEMARLGHASGTYSPDGHKLTIDQTTDQAILQWQNFDIAQGHTVQFIQPSATSVALNNIQQGNPSQIFGSLTANGQVYLVNQNGFVFGPNSQVNVNALVATTLNISTDTFQSGITRAFDLSRRPALAATDANGNPIRELYLKDDKGQPVLDTNGEKVKIQILLEPGAQVKTNAANGRIVMAAPSITNRGSIEAADGQVILAAAQDKVYLQVAGSTNPNVRGLLVEVGTGGDVNNIGKVMAERGNATLIGFAVNQQGLVSATTSVNLNGSVRLLAREGVQASTIQNAALQPASTKRAKDLGDGLGVSANVTLGKSSLTSVELDADKSLTAVDAQTQSRSNIEISGHQVHLYGGSTVQAISGNVSIAAVDNPADTAIKGDGSITLDAGSTVDVSGLKNVILPIQRNVVQVELRNNELRDSPKQKNGILHGQTVSVDLRSATQDSSGNWKIPIADISGAVARIARNIDERSTSAGAINLSSSGTLITRPGSLLDFSGGSVSYQGGIVNTTKLVADNGQLVDIGKADPNLHYIGIFGQWIKNYAKWGITDRWVTTDLAGMESYQSGYVEGKPAGSLYIASYAAALDGTLTGGTVDGKYQRLPAERATAGALSIDLSRSMASNKQDVVLAQSAAAGDLAGGQSPASGTPALTIDTGLWNSSGIANLSLKTNGRLTIEKDANLTLPANGKLSLSAAGFDVQGSITAPSGTVSLQPVKVGGTIQASPITLESSSLIDVQGQWVNDLVGPASGPVSIDGGSVTLTTEQGDLRLERGSRIDVSGGAWLQSGNTASAGKAGAISLTAQTSKLGAPVSNLILRGELDGWALQQGGSLSLSANEVVIGAASAAPHTADSKSNFQPLVLPPEFFQQGGFGSYNITSNLDGLTVAAGTLVRPLQLNLQLPGNAGSMPTGENMRSFSQTVLLPDFQRKPANLTLSFAEAAQQDIRESLTVQQGALIQTDAQAAVHLNSDTSVLVDGSIEAPAGQIGITVTPHLGSGDYGYYASQGIWLGSGSQLSARGVFLPQPDGTGLRKGSVLPGGTIDLTAGRGYIVAPGQSLMDVSGTSATLDFLEQPGSGPGARVVSKNIPSDAGSITLQAGEGILADGSFRATPGGPGAAGGSFTLALNSGLRGKPTDPVPGHQFPDDINPKQARTIIVSASSSPAIPANLVQGSTIPANPFSGHAFLNSPQLDQAGFASVKLATDAISSASSSYVGSIVFKGDVRLQASRQIVLDAPSLAWSPLTGTDTGDVVLDTAYAALGSTSSRIDTQLALGAYSTTLAPAASTGPASLNLHAQGIDLVGGLSFNGFGRVGLNSRGDVRAIGIAGSAKNYRGEMNIAGDLTIQAQQVYPATLTDYRINGSGTSAQTVRIQATGGHSAPVYSAGGSFTIAAPNIRQAGVLKAPFGQLALNAANSLELDAGSLTSVSGGGLAVPFGQGAGGKYWLYPVGTSNIVIDTPPAKNITLTAPKLALRPDAKVDLSGGGDLYAYEFITGPGGSNDVLDPNAPGFTPKFAVIPGVDNILTPYDPFESGAAKLNTATSLQNGDSVYLSGGAGLPAGQYTLLPAHYALLPGAYLVAPVAGSTDLAPGQTFADPSGATVVAGRYGVAGTAIQTARWQGFAVEPGAVARSYSQYQDYSANQFFADRAAAAGSAAPQLPRDAGTLALSASTSLNLGASLNAAPDIRGLGGQVDISADHLAIIGRPEDAQALPAGDISILAGDLNRLNAPSLLLGGLRSQDKNGQRVTVGAKTLEITGDADLKGQEILLAARNQVKLDTGAVVESSGKTGAAGGNLLISNQVAQNAPGNSDGAFLRVSAAGQANVIRDQAVTGTTGTLVVETGARLQADGSMLLDSSKDTRFDGAIAMQGGSLALKSSKISIGNVPADTPGLVLPSLPYSLDELQLTSATDLNLYGGATFNAKQVDIAAAAINGYGNAGATSTITADTLALSNPGSTATSAGSGTGGLSLNAREIDLGGGQYTINGFSHIAMNATETLKGLAQGIDPATGSSIPVASGTLKVAGDLAINAGRIGGDSGATTAIDASGHRVTVVSAGTAAPAGSSGLGASWTITADAIDSSGRFDLPSGILNLKALQGDISLAAGSAIDVSGRAVSFGDVTKVSSAGNVLLEADKGNIALAPGAAIDLAGAPAPAGNGGAAGLLDIRAANGSFDWSGNIQAGAAGGAAQGRFRLDVLNFGAGGFSALNGKLGAAGFTEEVTLEQRSGDAAIAQSDSVKAHSFQLTVDQGAVAIGGTIDASGRKAGEVSIYGRNGITLGATGKILARAQSAGAAGGAITLDSVHRDDGGTGLLDLSASGGLIDVSAGVGGAGGAIHLRTGRDDSAHTIAVTAIDTRFLGADPNRLALEAARVYTGLSDIRAADIAHWQTDTANFMNSAPALTGTASSAVSLMPGIEIRASGNLSLSDKWDFEDGAWITDPSGNGGQWQSNWRYGGQHLPGFLTLRAGGDLNIHASLTDAFAMTPLPGGDSTFLFQDLLQPGLSWSYNLTAGGNVNLANTYRAPDPLGLSAGDIATQVVVRTGTGNIGITAGGNIVFVNDPQNPQAAAAVYTMGRPAAYTLADLQSGNVPGFPAQQSNQSLNDYLASLDPNQMNALLRFGYGAPGLDSILADYPTGGGTIGLHAGGDILGIQTGQPMTDWLVRSGSQSDHTATAWGINLSGDFSMSNLNNSNLVQNPNDSSSFILQKGIRNFNQDVGALGGGDVTVEAGGDVSNLSVMLPSTGKPFAYIDQQYHWQNQPVVNGGGELRITAGNDIVGGEFYAGLGSARLSAAGSIRDSASNLGPILEVGDAGFSAQARKDLNIGTVFNPTLLAQNVLPNIPKQSYFFTYGPNSAVDLSSTAGDVVLENNLNALPSSLRPVDNTNLYLLSVYPATLSAAALSGNIRIENSFTLSPSPSGQLELLAGENIGTDQKSAMNMVINMSDADPSLLPSAASTIFDLSATQSLLKPPASAASHALTPVHQGQASKAEVIAKLGDIAFPTVTDGSVAVAWYLPQASEFRAGRDIRNVDLSAQNLSAGDITLIMAGRDITYDSVIDGNGVVQSIKNKIQLGGPGQLRVAAGRDISLGSSAGIVTIGNTLNAALPASTGASVNLLAGVSDKIDYAGFIAKYAANATYQTQLAGLAAKPGDEQSNTVLGVLFNEIKLSAAAAAAAPAAQRAPLYKRGFDAIQALFPGNQYQGDLSLVFSQIKTVAGGDINMAVPGGNVDVGLAGKVAGLSKAADQLGIVVEQQGDLNAFTHGDFNVNQARVFTQGGGDIAVWSSYGSIDAGKGAKSVISAPPPITSTDSKGNIVLITQPITAGSGIQAVLPANSGTAKKQGNIYLAAPQGVVNAGEAGISGGKIVIAATAVIGASNIQASNGTVGVPTAVAPPVVPAGANSATAGAAKSGAQMADSDGQGRNNGDKQQAPVSLFSSTVVGYGNCSVGDVRDGKAGCGG